MPTVSGVWMNGDPTIESLASKVARIREFMREFMSELVGKP
jgi:hypothetical protein